MEQVWSTSRRGLSARSILTFVLTVFITALLWVAFGSHTQTHAADGDATWKGESILYNGHQYFSGGEVKDGDSVGLPAGSHYYLYTPSTTTEDTSSQTNTNTTSAPKTQKAFVIYFAPGVDPPKEKTATLVTYDYSSTKVFSHPTDKKTINVTVKGDESTYSSCTVEGIGWIICPITTFLADGMDFIFNMVKGFLVVQPANTTNTNNDLYIAWNIMRGIANIAFIIVFLIIIYSQLTSMGVSNYGLKKLLPRLIIAAVLVNLSYIICALALDISNILGYSLQDIFNTIRQNTFNINNDTWADTDAMGWSAVTAFVLSGGAATIGVIAATGGTIAGAVYLLVPILIALVTTVLVVLLILAARQAIIVILIVIAPLAFVAFLLPNTEQWFKKWRDLFMTMLVFFPAFSLVFGGSQLAGGIIIQSATSIVGVIFGLAVQVAPLIITPLLLKLSGGLLGKIAGLVNDPKKGLLDRTKAWSGARAEMHRQRGIGDPNLKKNQVFRRAARGLAYSNRRVEKRTEQYKAGFDEYGTRRDVTSRGGQKVEVETALSKLATEEMHHGMGQAMEELRAGDASGLTRLRAERANNTAEAFRSTRLGGALTGGQLTQADITKRREERLADNKSLQKYGHTVLERAVELDQSSRAIETATSIAKNVQLTNYATAIENEKDLAAFTALKVKAGGIGGERGQQGALAAAFKAQAAAHGDAVANAGSILGHYNYSDDVILEIADGKKPADGRFENISAALKEAAITKIASGGNANAILRLMQTIEINDTDANQDFRQAFADALISNSAKPKFAGATILSNMKQGKDKDGNPIPAPGKGRIDSFIVSTINADKFGSADTLVNQDPDYLNALLATLSNNESGKTIDDSAKTTILKAIRTAKKNALYAGRIGERKDALNDIEALLVNDPNVGNPQPDKEA